MFHSERDKRPTDPTLEGSHHQHHQMEESDEGDQLQHKTSEGLSSTRHLSLSHDRRGFAAAPYNSDPARPRRGASVQVQVPARVHPVRSNPEFGSFGTPRSERTKYNHRPSNYGQGSAFESSLNDDDGRNYEKYTHQPEDVRKYNHTENGRHGQQNYLNTNTASSYTHNTEPAAHYYETAQSEGTAQRGAATVGTGGSDGLSPLSEKGGGNMFELFRTHDGEEYTVYRREDGKKFYVDWEEQVLHDCMTGKSCVLHELLYLVSRVFVTVLLVIKRVCLDCYRFAIGQKWRYFPSSWNDRGYWLPIDYDPYQVKYKNREVLPFYYPWNSSLHLRCRILCMAEKWYHYPTLHFTMYRCQIAACLPTTQRSSSRTSEKESLSTPPGASW